MTSSWSGKPIIPGEIPETIYRNTLDLNRFSNSVSKKLVLSYNRVILDAVKKLEAIEKMPKAKQPAYKAARLRSLLRQVKNSLDGWSNKSSDSIIKDLDGIAKLQSEFAMDQLAKALPSGVESVIHPINVSDSFAKSVVNTSPTQLNASLLSDDLKGKVTGRFSLTAKEGALINLPNGKSVRKSFRGLAASQADLFGKTVRDGMLTGETTPQIASRLIGTLSFGQEAKSVKQIALAGGQATKMANHQIQTIVHSAVQQVSNTASQTVYKSNSDITDKYRYVATLDTRTSPICRDLDGQEFEYGKGPEPLQHFRCRSTTVAVLNYEKLGVPPPSKPLGRRAAAGGSVPAGTTYGKWLSQQNQKVKGEALGKSKVKYFNAMSKKYGPDQAIKKFVQKDGSEKTLTQLQKSYGKTPTTSKRLKKETIPRPKIAGPGTPPLRLTKKDPLAPTWDPDEALRKAQANTTKNYVGSGAFGSVYKLDGNPPTVIKKGQFGRREVEALDRLKDTGITPKVLGQKYTTDWRMPSDLYGSKRTKIKALGIELKHGDALLTREGSVVMTQAKGTQVNELLGRGVWQGTVKTGVIKGGVKKPKDFGFGDYSNPKNLKQRDLMLDEYIRARKTMHMRGISHNDMHGDNFFFDTKTNKGTVIDFGLAQINRKSALIEAIGVGTGGDETAQLMMMEMLGDRPTTAHKLYTKLGNNIIDVKLELERRGKGNLAMEMVDWETGMDFSKPKYAGLSDELAGELLKIVYKGI